MTTDTADQLAVDVEDACRALDARRAPSTARNGEEVVRSAHVHLQKRPRPRAFTFAARLVLGERVAALPSPFTRC